MPVPSARMMAFLQFLPPNAFLFTGEVGVEDKLLFSIATPGSPPASSADFGRVSCRVGWRDQSWDKVTVTFYLPAKGGAGSETFSICIRAAAWGKLPAPSWKAMILASAPYGVMEYPN
ncbi:hypothetical protein FRB99_007305 [Tulasnella sp. 403]|nr:hypothetical protein FRB99_007305 [Tulasnella sp. 403]